jgi:alanyl-tRNA synthetase
MGWLKDPRRGIRKNARALLSECDGRLLYVLSTGAGFPLDVSELMPAVNAALGGKGGGRGTLAQGTSATISGSVEALEQIKSYFVKRLSDQR